MQNYLFIHRSQNFKSEKKEVWNSVAEILIWNAIIEKTVNSLEYVYDFYHSNAINSISLKNFRITHKQNESIFTLWVEMF